MKGIYLSIICLIGIMSLLAQEKMTIHKSDNTTTDFLVSEIDNMALSTDLTLFNIFKTDNSSVTFSVSDIDSLTFGNAAIAADAIMITYLDGGVYVTNPYAGNGVEITTSGQDVTVNSTMTDAELQYVVSGTTTDGSLKIYSTFKLNLMLNGVDITNHDGAAINIQSGKKMTVTLLDGTINYLTDGSTYTETSGEDMKSAFFSEGQLVFEGNGTLYVEGNYKHAICSDDYIRINSGSIIVTSASKDGIHCNDYFRMDGGSVNITSSSDGIECEKGYIQINGGTQNIVVKGIASKAIKSSADMTINNGSMNLTTTGNAYYDTDDKDTSSAAGIKCDGKLQIVNGDILINSSGSGGKGISVDGELIIDGGYINVTTTGSQYTYNSANTTAAKAIKSDSNLTVNGGHIIISTSKTEAEGLESKDTLTINGGTVEIDAYDDGINASNHIQINGGTIYVYSQTNDGTDSNGTITIAGGMFITSGAANPEGGIDCDQKTFKITGGIVVATGGSNSSPTSSASTQRSIVYGAGSITSGQYLQIKSSAGDILVYKIPRTYNSMSMVFSSPDLMSGTTYTIVKGGSVSGGTDFHGLYTGATYTGGTTANTFNPTSMVTTVGSSSGGGRP